jgi:hypothetical protein
MRRALQSGTVPAAAVFFGSFLLFMIQPMLGRTLLPVFGGSAAVWNVCLGAYQILLLAGYAYAHLLVGQRVRTQRAAHLTLLALAVAWAFAFPSLRLSLKGMLSGFPVPSLAVLLGVLVCVGLPYVLLAAGSTWVQAWVAAGVRSQEAGGRSQEAGGRSQESGVRRQESGARSQESGGRSQEAGVRGQETGGGGQAREVYSLYAVSNVGSLSGLLSYPFVLEPFVPLTAQWYAFAAGLGLYALLIVRVVKREAPPVTEASCSQPEFHSPIPDSCSPTPAFSFLWFLLPAVSAFLLNAVIAHLFVDVTPMPLVWVVMLAVFLLSYVVGFSRFGEGRRGVWCALSALALVGTAVANGMWGTGSFYPNAAAAVALVFCVGVLLHGWLYAERPDTTRLTRFYLAIAAGGAAGGLLASLIAPLVFNRVLEYPLVLLVCVLLVAWRMPQPAFVARSRRNAGVYLACCCAAWLALVSVTARSSQARVLFRDRNFYGCLKVTKTFESFGKDGVLPVHYLWYGQTTHGIQVISPLFKGRGTSYYGQTGGGIVFSSHPKWRAGQGVKVGVVGLGAGCLACYGKSADLFRFYEINPQAVRVATDPNLFTFLSEAPMPIDLVLGDARQMLEKERAARDPLYDILIVDAYSGDAVPYHLATVEAFRLYFDRLAPDGILAVHVSNWHIDLLPLCKAVAGKLGVSPYGVVGVAENSVTTGAMWVFMTRQPRDYTYPGKSLVREVAWPQIRDVSAPSDEKGSLIPLLRF